jgi:hypothetical protein
MPTNKRPTPRKPSNGTEQKDEQALRELCQLALNLSEQEDRSSMGTVLRDQEEDFKRLVRKLLNQQKDELLYSAIELSGDEDIGAYQYLRAAIEEAAANLLLRRDGAPTMEIDAFAIPLFVHSTGGLQAEQVFQSDEDYQALVDSFQQAQLESAKAKVVLMRHVYDLKEIDAITYTRLTAMVREAAHFMTEKKLVPVPTLERSMSGWAPTSFGADDTAVELRFLLGFALKRADDPFYRVPKDEAAADAYFTQRMERYQQWTAGIAPLLQRCLAGARAPQLTLNFLYQDLFFGAKEQALAEYATLQMLSELNQALQASGVAPEQAAATIGPADAGHQMLLRVQLSGPDGAVLINSERPLDLAADLEQQVDDVRDALDSIGVRALSVTKRFDAQGRAVEPQTL